MNKQRKVLITITYNKIGIIIDTKAEEVQQPKLQPTCNQLATDCISRQAAIDAADRADYTGLTVEDVKKVTDEVVKELKQLPSIQPQKKKGRWFWTDGMYACDQCHEVLDEKSPFCPMCGADMRGEQNEGD